MCSMGVLHVSILHDVLILNAQNCNLGNENADRLSCSGNTHLLS